MNSRTHTHTHSHQGGVVIYGVRQPRPWPFLARSHIRQCMFGLLAPSVRCPDQVLLSRVTHERGRGWVGGWVGRSESITRVQTHILSAVMSSINGFIHTFVCFFLYPLFFVEISRSGFREGRNHPQHKICNPLVYIHIFSSLYIFPALLVFFAAC